MTGNPTPHAVGKTIRTALVIAAAQVGGALLLTSARSQGMIDEETVTRGVMMLIGLSLAVYGNAMPKTLDGPPSQSLRDVAARQAILRVGGWAMVMGGLAFAILWALAPRDVALIGSMTAVGSATIVTVGYTAWRFLSGRRHSS